MDLLKYIYFPFVFFLIVSVGLMVLIFDFLYELFVNLLKSEDDDWIWRNSNGYRYLLYSQVDSMEDVDYLYNWAQKIGKRPTEDDEYTFVETIGKLVNDGYSEMYARREAFKRLYSQWLDIYHCHLDWPLWRFIC